MLRAEHVTRSGVRTRRTTIPQTRATADIDCFLNVEIISNRTQTELIRAWLDRNHYRPTVLNLQFERTVEHEGQERRTKFDFRAAPVPRELADKVKIDQTRIRPKGFSGLHGRVTPEAFAIERELLAFDIGQADSEVVVYLPHPFSFLILKLFALRDRLKEHSDDEGKYHALDMFSIWAMLTEGEWQQANEFRAVYAGHPLLEETRTLVLSLFADLTSPGTLALRDQARRQGISITDGEIREFISDLQAVLLGA